MYTLKKGTLPDHADCIVENVNHKKRSVQSMYILSQLPYRIEKC